MLLGDRNQKIRKMSRRLGILQVWGTENAIVHLELRDADVSGPVASSPIRFEMYALPPMRISADSLDLIALPLVDIRWFWQHTYPTSQTSIESWRAFFESLHIQLPGYSSLGVLSFPENFLEFTCETLPDIALQTTTVPVVRLLDASLPIACKRWLCPSSFSSHDARDGA